MGHARTRLRLEAGLAALSALLFVVTLISREWIEVVFGVDPDGGSGGLEWGILAAAAACAVVAGLLARADLRRLRAAEPAA